MSIEALYDSFIRKKLEDSVDIERIKMLECETVEEAVEALEELVEDEGWPDDLTLEEWAAYVEEYRIQNPIPIEVESATIGDRTVLEDLTSRASDPRSSWTALKKFLQDDAGLSVKSIRQIERSGYEVLHRLKRDTRETGTVKGLVYGSVQSGKTVNMETLVSMAADSCWNIFIVLSGTIESLRVQTRNRFRDDLQSTESVVWNHIDLSGEDKNLKVGELRLDPLNDPRHAQRYLITCLKNKARLTRLIDWLYSDTSRAARMRLVVIDDEADQASVNTAEILTGEDAELYEQERKEINRLIVCLANGLRADGSTPSVKMQAINYISYTATPYANVLNESSQESLYPKDFVHSLAAPDEYFGANVIFGNREYIDDQGNPLAPGLDIVRVVPKSEMNDLSEMHKDGYGEAPEELQRALCWFLCCAAVLRSRQYKKPISMLVHTSARGAHHSVDYQLVETFLRCTELEKLIALCRKVYAEETSRFTFSDLERGFPSYGLIKQVDPELPEFDLLVSEIKELKLAIGNIRIGDDDAYDYSPGINICIDNCYADREVDGNVKMRVVYPTDQLASMSKAPVFIVIGGNTLARGLTIEGLVCTYFTRKSEQADTLMQMARWFGYRKKMELLQRIWLTEDAWTKFRALSRIEMNLKEEIKRFAEMGIKPENLGVKVRTMPEVAKFRLSAKNKTQMAVACDYDYSGYTYETTEFDNDEVALSNNICLTEKLIEDISGQMKPQRKGSVAIWRNIGSERILEFLREFNTSEHSDSRKEDTEFFLRWIEGPGADRIDSWDVAVAGKANSASGTWSVGEIDGLPRVERAKLKTKPDWIDVGSLRSGADALCDIDESSLSAEQKRILREGGLNKNVGTKRARLGMDRIPLLLLYRIDSASQKAGTRREPIGTENDIIGYSVILPGDKHVNGNISAMWIEKN